MLMAKILLVILALVAMVTVIVLSVVTYANDTQYYSYTKTIKSCGNGGCVMRDILVQCLGDTVIDIKSIGVSYLVSDKFSSGLSALCG